MTDMDIEKEIVAKGKTAARVTPERIEAVISGEFYFTGADGYRSSPLWLKQEEPEPAPQSLELLTFCVLVLENGFTVTGESACASPENFDPEIGRKIARQNAIAKIWPLEGYLLKQQLHGHGFGDYEYIDIVSAGIDKEKLSDLVGKPVETIPQVFVNGEPIGGYTEFAAFASTL